jgi:two-component system phosphate regulon sensor histidine kinase PhoR
MIELFAILTCLSLAALAVTWFRLRHARASLREAGELWKTRAELELRQAREERDRLLDALGDAFLLVNGEGNIRFANRAARDLFGGREIVDRPVAETFLDRRLAAALLQSLETGQAVQSRVVLPQQTSPRGDLETRGVNAWVIDAAPLRDSPAAKPLTRVVIRDVTAEHQLEQIRKDFVANASHELRTPLAIINGYLENLLDDGLVDDSPTARRFLSIMRKHADRISRIVEDMLMISRLESGEAGALKVEPFRFGSCVHDVLERLEALILLRQADVIVVTPDGELEITGDRFYWTQVLFNLVENALKQNQHKGLRIEIGCDRHDSQLRIWVADNGVGIPSADLPHIFRRFYRVEKHHSQQEIKGTGLGLSIVKRAVEAHGGTIRVTSTPGRDTRFMMELPASSATARRADGPADPSGSHLETS